MMSTPLKFRKPDGFYYEARRIIDEQDLPPEVLPNIEWALRHRSFIKAIQPLLKAKGRIVALALPTRRLHQDGRMETVDDGLTEEQRNDLAQIDEFIASIADQHGLAQ